MAEERRDTRDERAQRLARALRDNLRRRKAQAREGEDVVETTKDD